MRNLRWAIFAISSVGGIDVFLCHHSCLRVPFTRKWKRRILGTLFINWSRDGRRSRMLYGCRKPCNNAYESNRKTTTYHYINILKSYPKQCNSEGNTTQVVMSLNGFKCLPTAKDISLGFLSDFGWIKDFQAVKRLMKPANFVCERIHGKRVVFITGKDTLFSHLG